MQLAAAAIEYLHPHHSERRAAGASQVGRRAVRRRRLRINSQAAAEIQMAPLISGDVTEPLMVRLEQQQPGKLSEHWRQLSRIRRTSPSPTHSPSVGRDDPRAASEKRKAARNKKQRRRRLIIGLSAVLLVLVKLVRLTDALRFNDVQVPALVQRGANFWLACQYELEEINSDSQDAERESLYSVKWYKNNEEFYRLINTSQQQQPSGPNGLSQSASSQFANSGGHRMTSQHQYFTQAGVNVLMGSSNATHVRLLNASLDTEGVYACEISTENLSTIRSERELRLFVLPQARLSVTGLRDYYAIGDQVELRCQTDFTRPKPVLSWFVNGLRIVGSGLRRQPESEPEAASGQRRRNGGDGGKGYSGGDDDNDDDDDDDNGAHVTDELSRQLRGSFRLQWHQTSRSKSNEPGLVRTSLTLKFKLDFELLRRLQWLGSANGGGLSNDGNTQTATTISARSRLANANKMHYLSSSRNNGHGGSNQSQSSDRKWPQMDTATASQPLTSIQLNLRCKYKLTEVTDIAYNELDVRLSSSSITNHENGNGDRDEDPYLVEYGTRTQRQQSRAGKRAQIIKFANDNRVKQTPVPDFNLHSSDSAPDINERLIDAIVQQQQQQRTTAAADGCTKFNLKSALMLDDPLIVGWTRSDDWNRTSATDDEESMNDDDSIIGAKLEQPEALRSGDASVRPSKIESARGGARSADLFVSIGQTIRLNCSTTRALVAIPDTADLKNGLANREHTCADAQVVRLRGANLPIDLDATPGGQVTPVRRTNWRAGGGASVNRQPAGVAYLLLRGDDEGNDNRAVGAPQWSSLATAKNTVAVAGDSSSHSKSQSQQQPPPLLEWFINNQEAPKLADYLPLLPVPQRPARLLPEPPDGATGRPDAAAAATTTDYLDSDLIAPDLADKRHIQQVTIDYNEYFANIADQRSLEQWLPLEMTVERAHFPSPDSVMKLRCSSTQAHTLHLDSVQISIVPILSNDKDNLITNQSTSNKRIANQGAGVWRLQNKSHIDLRHPVNTRYSTSSKHKNGQSSRAYTMHVVSGATDRRTGRRRTEAGGQSMLAASSSSSRATTTYGLEVALWLRRVLIFALNRSVIIVQSILGNASDDGQQQQPSESFVVATDEVPIYVIISSFVPTIVLMMFDSENRLLIG